MDMQKLPDFDKLINDNKLQKGKKRSMRKLLDLVKEQGDLFTHDVMYEILVRYADKIVESRMDSELFYKAWSHLQIEISNNQEEMKRLSAEIEVLKKLVEDMRNKS